MSIVVPETWRQARSIQLLSGGGGQWEISWISFSFFFLNFFFEFFFFLRKFFIHFFLYLYFLYLAKWNAGQTREGRRREKRRLDSVAAKGYANWLSDMRTLIAGQRSTNVNMNVN